MAENVPAPCDLKAPHLRKKAERGYAVDMSRTGAAKVVAKLVAERKVKAAIGIALKIEF